MQPKKNSIIKTLKLSKKKILVFIFFVAALVASFLFVLKDIPESATIGANNYPQSTKIYDRNGKMLYTFYTTKNQTFVSLDKISENLKKATIAIEDRDFYKHGAIDLRGITRAFIYTVFKKQVQGGSTITQQLVKNSLLTPERTITRKIKEIILHLFFILHSAFCIFINPCLRHSTFTNQ